MKKRIKKILKKIYLFANDYIIYNLFGFSRLLLSRFDENYNTLRKLHNIHLGERCFIVATGPSLTVEDVEKLNNEVTFSVNSIFLIFDKTEWRSTYYVCLDELHLEKVLDKYSDSFDSVCKEYKFFNLNSKKSIDHISQKIGNALFFPISRINQLNYMPTSHVDHFYFRTDPVRGIYNSGTVTNSAIILAMYMGFKTIYLLGADCNYSTKIKHVGKDWNDDVWTISERELIELRMKNGFNEIAKIAKKNGVQIYNATRGGMLESFERVDFDSIDFRRVEQ